MPHPKMGLHKNPIIREIHSSAESAIQIKKAAFVGVFHQRNHKPELLVGDNTNKGERV
jgi:hypothetical protein